MYGHLKALTRMGDGVADVPIGTSMETESRPRGAAAPAAAGGWGARTNGSSAAAAPPAMGAAKVGAADNALKTIAKDVGGGNARVHGFASNKGSGSALHSHADSFQRSKGVVNTVG